MRVVAIVVILLLSLVTFNAYACLVPVFPSPHSMAGNCSSPQEGQGPQFCDLFKAFSVEATATSDGGQEAKLNWRVLAPLRMHAFSAEASDVRSPSRELFLKLAVLRI